MDVLSGSSTLERVAAPRITVEEETVVAKKDKKARRLARKRKVQRSPQPAGRQILLKRARTSEHVKDAQMLVNPAGTEKMSAVILHFAEPFQDAYGVVPPKMIQFAILVWNASLLPQDAQPHAIKTIVNLVPVTEREARREIVLLTSMLLERKAKYFADNTRYIMDYHITESAHRINLNVVSTVAEGYDPDRETAR